MPARILIGYQQRQTIIGNPSFRERTVFVERLYDHKHNTNGAVFRELELEDYVKTTGTDPANKERIVGLQNLCTDLLQTTCGRGLILPVRFGDKFSEDHIISQNYIGFEVFAFKPRIHEIDLKKLGLRDPTQEM